MSSTEATATATTLTSTRQSSQLLKLLRSAMEGSIRDLRLYLARGGDPNARIYVDPNHDAHVSIEEYTGFGALRDMSPLAVFSGDNRADQIGLLLDAGADPESDTGTALSPMAAAAATGHIPTMELLRSKGAKTDCVGRTPLMAASETGMLEAVKWLVNHEANIAAVALVPDTSGRMHLRAPVLCAAIYGHLDVLRFLYAQGVSFLAEAGGQVHTALHHAAARGHVECVRFILACGFAVDTQKSNGLTALHLAASSGHTAVMEQLVAAGACIDTGASDESTPLQFAMMPDKPQAVALLVAKGALIRDGRAANSGLTYGSIAALKALMTHPRWLAMSRTERLQAECRLLHYVKDKPALDFVRSVVLDMAALVHHQYSDGDNALHIAAIHSRAVPLICALIKEGVDPTAKNDAGQTPADVASEAGHALQATLLGRAADDKRRRDLQQQQQQNKN